MTRMLTVAAAQMGPVQRDDSRESVVERLLVMLRDAHAHGVPSHDEPTYDVRFHSAELWPEAADNAFVHVGVFQSYLIPAP